VTGVASSARPLPDLMDRARDALARRAEREHPGWAVRHGLLGWAATRHGDRRTVRADSLPGLLAMIGIVGAEGTAEPDPPARWAAR
jgi:hypothetical protein